MRIEAFEVGDSVFLLWHVHHVAEDPDGEVRHFADADDFWADEENGDDVKLLGVYSSRENAVARIEQAKEQNGFREEPRCFYIATHELDRDSWEDGFRTV